MAASSEPSSGTETPTEKASDHSSYRLRVTAGTSYDTSTHRLVPVNASETLLFENESMILALAVRIKKFTGIPSSSPKTTSYFQHKDHTKDQYSIAFSFIPKKDISGKDLVFGNDFERPIRDRLPPGFNWALNFVKGWIDPGLDGDVYSDKPYLYGPALSSWNVLRIGDKVPEPAEGWKHPGADSFHEDVVEEGGDGSGEEVRDDLKIPADASSRKKFFLKEENREEFNFEKGRLYQADFGNPYLDFNTFSLKLPGFTLNVIKYVDSKTHELRYTMKNKATDEVYAVVLFTLLFGEELDELAQDETKGLSTNRETTPPGSSAKAAEPTEQNFGSEPAPADDDVD